MFSEEQHQQNLRVRALELSIKLVTDIKKVSVDAQDVTEAQLYLASDDVVGYAEDFYKFLKGEAQ